MEEEKVLKQDEEGERQGQRGSEKENLKQKHDYEKVHQIFEQLSQRVGEDRQSIYTKINRISFGAYSEEDQRKIEELLDAWKQYEIEILIESDDFTGEQYHHLYKGVNMLSARVYEKVLAYYKVKRTQREQGEHEEFEKLRELLWKGEYQFSFDRYFWRRRTIKPSGISYHKEGYQRDMIQDTPSDHEGSIIADWIQRSQIKLLKGIQKFMTDIHLIKFEGDVENSFILKLERISKKDQKELFLKSIAFEAYQDAKALHTSEFKSNDHQKDALAAVRKSLQNYYFYKASGNGPRTIGSLHSKFQNYKFLENRHDYIQWMFPNHYGSSFNSSSFQLTYLEKQLFIDDKEIGMKLLSSIYLFLDFMGIELHFPGLNLTVCSFERLRDAILINYHNHLRIMRLLACLSVTGFRKIALNLVKELDKLTTGPTAFLKKQRSEFERSWEIYGDQTPGVPKEVAKAMCFLELEDFPSEHQILTILSKIKGIAPEPQHKIQPEFEEEEKKKENIEAMQVEQKPKNNEDPKVQEGRAEVVNVVLAISAEEEIKKQEDQNNPVQNSVPSLQQLVCQNPKSAEKENNKQIIQGEGETKKQEEMKLKIADAMKAEEQAIEESPKENKTSEFQAEAKVMEVIPVEGGAKSQQVEEKPKQNEKPTVEEPINNNIIQNLE